MYASTILLPIFIESPTSAPRRVMHFSDQGGFRCQGPSATLPCPLNGSRLGSLNGGRRIAGLCGRGGVVASLTPAGGGAAGDRRACKMLPRSLGLTPSVARAWATSVREVAPFR